MNLEALKEAIRRRKGKGLDLTIMLGAPGQEGPEGEMAQNVEEDESEKLMDLAPEVKDDVEMVEGEEGEMAHPDEEQDKALIAKMLDEYGKSPMRKSMDAMKKK